MKYVKIKEIILAHVLNHNIEIQRRPSLLGAVRPWPDSKRDYGKFIMGLISKL